MNKRSISKGLIVASLTVMSFISLLLNFITWFSLTKMKAVIHSPVNDKNLTIFFSSNAEGSIAVIVPGIYKDYELPEKNYLILSNRDPSRIIVDWCYNKDGIIFYTDEKVLFNSLDKGLGFQHELWQDEFRSQSSYFCVESIAFTLLDFPFNRLFLK